MVLSPIDHDCTTCYDRFTTRYDLPLHNDLHGVCHGSDCVSGPAPASASSVLDRLGSQRPYATTTTSATATARIHPAALVNLTAAAKSESLPNDLLNRPKNWRCHLSLNSTPEVPRTSGLHPPTGRRTRRTPRTKRARLLWARRLGLDHPVLARSRTSPTTPTPRTHPRPTAGSTTALRSTRIITARSNTTACNRPSRTWTIRMRLLPHRSPA